MGIAIIYNKELGNSWLGTSKRLGNIRECQSPSDINIEEYILKFHTKEYLESVKKLPFFRSACESIRCVITAADEVERSDVVVVPTSGTGHHAERDKWGGYSFFNDLAILLERLKEKGFEKIVVLETDAHHSDTYRMCSAKFFCISGEERCKEIREMRCGVARTEDAEKYVERFGRVMEIIEGYNPDILVWYLGQDLHEKEYSGLKLNGEGFRKMIEKFMELRCKKIVLFSSGSREDVFREILNYFGL